MAELRSDPIQRYLFDAVAGEKLDRAPSDYLVAYFDRFADTFDKQLVEVLGYDVPEKLSSMVEGYGGRLPRVLDLGCGTGLAGPRLRPDANAPRRRRSVAAHARKSGESAISTIGWSRAT